MNVTQRNVVTKNNRKCLTKFVVMQIFKTKIIYYFNTYVHTLEKKAFMQTPRHVLSPEQRDILRQTFQHLTKSRSTLLEEHIKEAMKKPEFASMIQELQDSQELTLEKALDLVKSSYRAWIRTKNK